MSALGSSSLEPSAGHRQVGIVLHERIVYIITGGDEVLPARFSPTGTLTRKYLGRDAGCTTGVSDSFPSGRLPTTGVNEATSRKSSPGKVRHSYKYK